MAAQEAAAFYAGDMISSPGPGILAVKRSFDIVCSFLGILVLSPLLLITAAVVAFTSEGGVFFRQERTGRGGKPFLIYKFRTMRKDNAGLQITTGDDSRVTKAGRVLRKYKLDELPQLFNVLKGDMSFVGPRPEVPEYTRLYTPRQQQIFLVRPGITDLASIRFRNENDLLTGSSDPNLTYIEKIMPQKLELGLEYIQNMSTGYDLKLILKTLVTVIRD